MLLGQPSPGIAADRRRATEDRHRPSVVHGGDTPDPPGKPLSSTRPAFFKNYLHEIVAADCSVMPTMRSQALFVFRLLAHERRRRLYFDINANPTASRTAQQLVEALPGRDPPRYLLRDRDGICGRVLRKRVAGMELNAALMDPQNPGQKGYASHCTSSIRLGAISGKRRRSESFWPCALAGGSVPGCS